MQCQEGTPTSASEANTVLVLGSYYRSQSCFLYRRLLQCILMFTHFSGCALYLYEESFKDEVRIILFSGDLWAGGLYNSRV